LLYLTINGQWLLLPVTIEPVDFINDTGVGYEVAAGDTKMDRLTGCEPALVYPM
jgi:hypothetical protein